MILWSDCNWGNKEVDIQDELRQLRTSIQDPEIDVFDNYPLLVHCEGEDMVGIREVLDSEQTCCIDREKHLQGMSSKSCTHLLCMPVKCYISRLVSAIPSEQPFDLRVPSHIFSLQYDDWPQFHLGSLESPTTMPGRSRFDSSASSEPSTANENPNLRKVWQIKSLWLACSSLQAWPTPLVSITRRSPTVYNPFSHFAKFSS